MTTDYAKGYRLLMKMERWAADDRLSTSERAAAMHSRLRDDDFDMEQLDYRLTKRYGNDD